MRPAQTITWSKVHAPASDRTVAPKAPSESERMRVPSRIVAPADVISRARAWHMPVKSTDAVCGECRAATPRT